MIVILTIKDSRDPLNYLQLISKKVDFHLQAMKKTNPRGWRDEFDERQDLLIADAIHELGGRLEYNEKGTPVANFTTATLEDLKGNELLAS